MNDDSFSQDAWFRTGDLGKIDRDGYLTVTGRIKEIVIRKGEKISIREVEDLLLSHPAIERASVVGISDPEVGERVCAALELAPGMRLNAGDVTEFLRAQGLATRKLPERIEFLRPLPRTDSGKVHRSAVEALFERARDEERNQGRAPRPRAIR
jgi:non-ribosomal peptide synthetase component E (peptide arylation enzyme)